MGPDRRESLAWWPANDHVYCPRPDLTDLCGSHWSKATDVANHAQCRWVIGPEGFDVVSKEIDSKENFKTPSFTKP